MNISKDVPYGTQCNGRKNFGGSMPGSLNYSPSESEGGHSRTGQVDLDKGLVGIDFTATPGTTPVKWRKGSGKAVPLVESSNTTVAKDPKSRGENSAATRRNSRSGSHQTSPGGDPAPAERLALKPSTRESASNATSWSDHDHKYMDGASGKLESGHVIAKCGPGVNGRGQAEAIGCDVRTELASAVCGDEDGRGQMGRHHQGRIIDDEDGRLPLDKTNFYGRTLGATDSSNNINDCERGAFDARKEVPHDGSLISKEYSGKGDNGNGKCGNGDDGNDDGGNGDGGNANGGDGDNGGGDNHAIEQNKDDGCSKSLMATARERHVEHRGIEAPVEGNGDLRGASEDPRERSALGDVAQITTMQNRSPARVSSIDTCYSVKDSSWRLGIQKSDHHPSVNVGGASPGVACGGNPSPTCNEDQKASRSVEHTPKEVGAGLGVEAVDKGANKFQGQSQQQHQGHPGGNPRPTEQGMTALTRSLAENHDKAAAEYEIKGIVLEDSTLELPSSGDVNDGGNAESHRDPQSPPVLSRKSIRQLEGHRIGRRHSYEEYTARVNRASERRFSLEQSTPYRVALDKSTPPQATAGERRPVPTLPGPHRSLILSPSPARPRSSQIIFPQSPVVIAARAVSHDESVRSTLYMQRAAKAVAIEDERMHLDSLGFEKAKEDRKWRQKLKKSAPHQNAELERDQALELTREVLRIKHAEKAQERVADHRSKAGRRRRRSPPRKPRKSKPSQDCHNYVARPIKDSVARSCGLSSTQLVLLRTSRELAEANNTQRKPDRQRTDRLAQPKAKRPATRIRDPATESLVKELTQCMNDKDKRAFLYACLADVKECTYSPNSRSSAQYKEGGNKRGDAENKKEQGEKEAFLYRVDAREKARNAAMEHRRGELMYNATLDKRVCPSCDIEQSYDEVQEGRKMCPNCEVEYRRPMTWAGVRKDFFKRMDTFEKSRRAFIEGAAKRQEKEIEMLALGCCDTRELERKKEERLYWEDIEGDFISRLQEDTARRQASQETLLATIAGEEYTFQPKLSTASDRFMRDSAWTEMTFLERLEADLQRRRDATFDERDVLMTDERL